MKYSLLLLLLVFFGQVSFSAVIAHPIPKDTERILRLSQVIYTSNDSLQIVRLLRGKVPEGREVLYYAQNFLGVPYVAHTLERADPEKLVVNLSQLDCTTLVETVLALSMTKRQRSDSFTDYCQNLMRLRYWDGHMDGYLSRLHYFSWWMEDNMRRQLVQEISHPQYFTRTLTVNNYYMSAHSSFYKYLKTKPARVDSIAKLEKKYNGKKWSYLPASFLGLPADSLSAIVRNGDIIALVTKKKGLDFSHLGFAVWGKDSKLHLLNASSLHHQVVDEPKTLQQYVREHPSCLGISVLRLMDFPLK